MTAIYPERLNHAAKLLGQYKEHARTRNCGVATLECTLFGKICGKAMDMSEEKILEFESLAMFKRLYLVNMTRDFPYRDLDEYELIRKSSEQAEVDLLDLLQSPVQPSPPNTERMVGALRGISRS